MRSFVVAAAVLLSAAPLSAQLIRVRTSPVSQPDQFDIFPFQNLGMGGVSIALHDSLLDPFRNPAGAARLSSSRLFTSPALYSVSADAGKGRSLPLGGFFRLGSWFAGAAVAFQQVDPSRFSDPFIFAARNADVAPGTGSVNVVLPPGVQQAPRSHGNEFAVLMLGRRLPERGLALAGSVSWAGLAAVDGVDMMYPGSESIQQSGQTLDLRLGALREWTGGRSLQALVLHNRLGLTHDVTFLDQFWDPATQSTDVRARQEHNQDRAHTWGLHLAYEQPLRVPGWKVGFIATANHVARPAAPSYEVAGVPSGPGTANAFNIGIGFSKKRGPSTFGIDVIYEPIWSRNWTLATVPTHTVGDTIAAGGRTSDNRFRFSNVLLRMGVSRELELTSASFGASAQLGLVVNKIGYRLQQSDHINALETSARQSWVEWAPTWGLSLRFPELEVRYRGSVTNGASRPSQFNQGVFFGGPVGPPGIGPGPGFGQTQIMNDVKVVTHQISLSLPLR